MSVSPRQLRRLLVATPSFGLLLAFWFGAEDPPLAQLRESAIPLLHVVVPALAAGLCLVPGRRSADRQDRWGWMLLGAAAATWWAGSVAFMVLHLSMDVPPYPSLADYLYIGYAVPALLAILVFAWSVPHAVSRAHTLVDGLVVAAGLLVIAWHLVLSDILMAPGPRDVAWAVTVTYLVVDITVPAAVLSLAWRLARARLPLALVGVGLVAVAVCDVFYVRAGMTGTLVVGEGVWQAGYTVGFLLVATAAVTVESTRPVEPTERERVSGRWLATAEQALVYVVLTGAVTVTALAPDGWTDDVGLVVLTVMAVLLAVVREGLVMADAAGLRTRLEEKVRERTRELDASRARLTAITQAANDAIVVIDDAGRLHGWNRGAEGLFACSAEQALGRELAQFIPERYRDRHRAGLRLRKDDPHVSFSVEVEALRADGLETPVELSVSGWDHEGERFYTGILRDISERRDAELLRERERAQMRLLQLVAIAANQSNQVDAAAATTLRLVATAFGWPVGHVMLFESEQADTPLRTAAWHLSGPEFAPIEEATEKARLTTDVGVLAMALRSRRPVWVTSDDPRLNHYRREAAVALGLRSINALPIRAGHRVVGVMEFFTEDDEPPDPDVIRLLDLVGTQLGRAVERDQAQRRLAKLALEDSLTGLANRVVFQERLELYLAQSAREKRVVGVILIDLDGFKEVNDTQGHAAGDRLLVEVGHRLKAGARAGDTVARLGGDEFAIAMSNAPGSDDVGGQVARLLDDLSRPVEIDGQQIRPRGSVGVALADAGQTAEVLLRNADLAMYDAKEAGKGRVSFFHPDMYERMSARLDLIGLLETAVESDALRVLYRPLVCLQNGTVFAQQAVLRWHHPTLGLLDPAEQLRTSEKPDLAERLAMYLLEQVCLDASAWLKTAEDMGVAVRLPSDHVTPPVVESLGLLLAEHQVPQELLWLEISGDVLSRGGPSQNAGIEALTQLGVGIAVEGLATGRLTLDRLRELDIRELKIGAHLTALLPGDPVAGALVDAIVTTAMALQVRVTAAGVTEPSQLTFLRARGCHAVRGPLVGDAVPAERLLTGRVADAAMPAPRDVEIQSSA